MEEAATSASLVIIGFAESDAFLEWRKKTNYTRSALQAIPSLFYLVGNRTRTTEGVLRQLSQQITTVASHTLYGGRPHDFANGLVE